MTRLTQDEFRALDAEWQTLRERHPRLDDEERARFAQLKATLFRDRP